MADRDPVPLPAEVRAKLAELELELSEGEYFSGRLCCCCWSLLGGQTGPQFEPPGAKESVAPSAASSSAHSAKAHALWFVGDAVFSRCGTLWGASTILMNHAGLQPDIIRNSMKCTSKQHIMSLLGSSFDLWVLRVKSPIPFAVMRLWVTVN